MHIKITTAVSYAIRLSGNGHGSTPITGDVVCQDVRNLPSFRWLCSSSPPVVLCNQHTAICRATAFKWVGHQLIKLYALGELDSMTFYHYQIEILREADTQGSLRRPFFRPLVSSVGVQSEIIIDVISLREQRETHFYSRLKCHHNATIEFRVFA